MSKYRLALIASCLLALAACNSGDAPAPTSVDTPAPAPAPAAAPAEPTADFTADSGAAAAEGGLCALDAVNGVPPTGTVVPGNGTFSGWVVDAAGAPPEKAMIVLTGENGRFTAPLDVSLERADVVTALGNQNALASGFSQTFSLGAVATGDYAVSLSTGANECPTIARIVIPAR